jgi:hypothetical protein
VLSKLKRIGAAVFAAAIMIGGAAACTEEEPTTTAEEQADKRDTAQDQMVENADVSTPDYSNDLANIDFWVDTWGTQAVSPGKLAYVYLLSADGDYIGYYILKGTPTSKCKMSTPTYDTINGTSGGYSQTLVVPAPGLSGTYSSGAGDCMTYFGQDASTGAYVEFAVGSAMTMLTFDQQYTLPEGVEPPPALGFTEFDDV